MTLDVTIGKIGKETHKLDEEISTQVDVVFQCPKADRDITDPYASFWPRESYRSGSSGFWEFWLKRKSLREIYLKMRKHPYTNDWDIAKIKPFAKAIAKLKESQFLDPIDKDRLKWLKYWTAKAIELYGDEAGIWFG